MQDLRQPLLPCHGADASGCPPAAPPAPALKRRLTTADACAAGLSLSLGAGAWVTIGPAARDMAGPAVVLAFLVAGAAAGEPAAWAAASSLLLSHALANAAVARALGPHLSQLAGPAAPPLVAWRGLSLDPAAAALVGACTLLQLAGTKRSAAVNNAINAAKALALAAVIASGLRRFDAANLAPFAPAGAGGVLQAASFVFMSVSGFDVVANLADEMRDPARSLPRAIAGSEAAAVAAFSLLALSLVGLQPAAAIDPAAPFGAALAAAGVPHARALVGGAVALAAAASALVGVLCVARQALALARAGLLPAALGRVSAATGAPWAAAVATGAPTAVVALVSDFHGLVHATNAAALLAIIAVCAALVWHRAAGPHYGADDPACTGEPARGCACGGCGAREAGRAAGAAPPAAPAGPKEAAAVAAASWVAAAPRDDDAAAEHDTPVSAVVIVRGPGAACAPATKAAAAAGRAFCAHGQRRLAAAGLFVVVAASGGASLSLHALGNARAAAACGAAWAGGAAAVAAAHARGGRRPPPGYAAPLFPLTPCAAVLLAAVLAGGLRAAAAWQLAAFEAAAMAYYYLVASRRWRGA
ncbi:MAG: amino acid permease-domain-containing protein [Monoraphidium minutum]|nr:MAG: amino acid permease-domain-containing protein [Monoraphidium minutum]